MSTLGPVIAIVLALLVAAGIAMIAWKLSSDKFHRSFEEDDSPGNDPEG